VTVELKRPLMVLRRLKKSGQERKKKRKRKKKKKHLKFTRRSKVNQRTAKYPRSSMAMIMSMAK